MKPLLINLWFFYLYNISLLYWLLLVQTTRLMSKLQLHDSEQKLSVLSTWDEEVFDLISRNRPDPLMFPQMPWAVVCWVIEWLELTAQHDRRPLCEVGRPRSAEDAVGKCGVRQRHGRQRPLLAQHIVRWVSAGG